ncbi:MAG: hypothetical protein DWQ08_11465 [Proteobacteria bacterium]|nr:MAG: hypothetical protein DWQ08_11465 [Pseudomonadota bacterium]
MPSDKTTTGDKTHLFDDERNVRLVVRALFACCALLLAADLFIHRHVVSPLEELFGFYAFFGFIACVVLVLLAKEMRKVLMRREDYYDTVDD